MNKIKKVIAHLKGDSAMFKREAKEDHELMHDLKKKKRHEMKESKMHEKREKKDEKKKPKPVKIAKAKRASKIKTVMHEFGRGELRSGSKKGPVVTNPKQALAIGYSEARQLKKKRK